MKEDEWEIEEVEGEIEEIEEEIEITPKEVEEMSIFATWSPKSSKASSIT